MDGFLWVCAVGAPLTVLAAALRNRFFAIFLAVIVGVQSIAAAAVTPELPIPDAVAVALQALVYLYVLHLTRPRMGTAAWRVTVALPALVWAGGSLLAVPWAVAGALGADWRGEWVPFALAFLGAVQSLFPRRTTVDLALDGAHVEGARRWPKGRQRVERPLRIVQITDPHLGPFMSERRFRKLCRQVVDINPDLVLLTGDYLTLASNRAPLRDGMTLLGRALEPLKALEGRTFACRGNHDLEAPEHVARGLAEAGVRLLVDDAVTVDTPAGPVQLVGADFHWRGAREKLAALDARHPRAEGALRLWLLHNPGHFKHLPDDAADLVLSGHTHGGQIGLVALGLPTTLVSLFSDVPDHGLWARGKARLYVHRGTGHYGFPVRVGVPAEESVLQIHRAEPPRADG